MPEMSGLEALVEIRKHDPKAKVVMVSAMGQEDIVRQAVLNGAKTFIVKPYKEEHIIQALKKVASI
jgi:two-component system chemotaxis response regulator CheY